MQWEQRIVKTISSTYTYIFHATSLMIIQIRLLQLIGHHRSGIKCRNIYNPVLLIIADIGCILFLLMCFQQSFTAPISIHIPDITAPGSKQKISVANRFDTINTLGYFGYSGNLFISIGFQENFAGTDIEILTYSFQPVYTPHTIKPKGRNIFFNLPDPC